MPGCAPAAMGAAKKGCVRRGLGAWNGGTSMNRREFLSTAAATAAVTTTVSTTSAADAGPGGGSEYYELRRYHLRRGPKQKVFEDYLRGAWLPAMGRLGIGPIGVFHVMLGPDSPSLYTLVPYKSLEQFGSVSRRLREDQEYLKAAEEAASAPAGDPVYLRVESSLFAAFSSMPRLEVPKQTAEGKGRIFELRIYESHSRRANLKKIQMFNEGEIALFRRTGLTPVFFGEAMVGSRMPNLTYMLVFDDLAARDTAWRTFGGHPEWKQMSSMPGFTDPEIVTDISNVLLRPASYSQV